MGILKFTLKAGYASAGRIHKPRASVKMVMYRLTLNATLSLLTGVNTISVSSFLTGGSHSTQG
jgi:hypothetical protein